MKYITKLLHCVHVRIKQIIDKTYIGVSIPYIEGKQKINKQLIGNNKKIRNNITSFM